MATSLELQQIMTSLFHFFGQIVAKNHLNIKDQNYGIFFPKNMTKLGYNKFIELCKTFLISFYNSD